MTPVTASMPMAANDTPYSPMTSPASPNAAPPNQYDKPIMVTTKTTDGSVDNLPCAIPSMVTVAAPVSDCAAMPFTGL